MSGGKRGVAIPTALFMVMVSLFLATLVTVKAREDMRLTGFQTRQVQEYYLARAAAEDALARLRNSPGLVASHGPGNPFHDVHNGYVMEGWSENHPTSSRVLLIHGKAYREGHEEQAEHFTISVTRDPLWDGLIWVRAGDEIWVLKGNSWARVPNPPLSYNYVLTVPGNLLSDPPTVTFEQYNGPAGTVADLTNFTGDISGNLYAQYLPPADARPPGTPVNATVEPLPTLLTYNVTGGGWQLSELPAGGGATTGLMAASAENLYTVVSGPGGDQLQVKTPSGDWTTVALPPGVPAGAAITSLTAGGRWDVSGPTSESNQVYAQFEGSGYNGLYKLTSGGWQSVSWPSQMSFSSSGTFQTSGASQPLDEIVAAPNGDLYGVWKRPDGPDTLYSLSDDGWSPLPPMKNYTYEDGEAVATEGYVSDLDNLEVDFRGHLLSQSGGANSLIYDGSAEPIPPIPGYGGAYTLLATGGYNTGVLGNFRTVSSH